MLKLFTPPLEFLFSICQRKEWELLVTSSVPLFSILNRIAKAIGLCVILLPLCRGNWSALVTAAHLHLCGGYMRRKNKHSVYGLATLWSRASSTINNTQPSTTNYYYLALCGMGEQHNETFKKRKRFQFHFECPTRKVSPGKDHLSPFKFARFIS